MLDGEIQQRKVYYINPSLSRHKATMKGFTKMQKRLLLQKGE